jgi:carbon monoxide dehydrogenase subunit G
MMEMTGEYQIPAPRQTVWAALNDIEVLRRAIPGCESMSRLSDDQIEATVQAKVGPVKASFKGMVTLSDVDPPNGYTIRGEGKGGAAGFARGGARVRLAEDAGGTRLAYTVDAAVGGKLAQIGSRLIDSTAKKLADEFFANFTAIVTGQTVAAQPGVAAASPAPAHAGTAASTQPEPAMSPLATPGTLEAPAQSPARKADPLSGFRPISFTGWIATLVGIVVAVGLISIIF